MNSKIHISLDDTKGIFKYLTARKNECKSIFETRTLEYLRKLHIESGAEFTLYCMCRSNDFHLNMVPDYFKEEFQANKSWLHWGFHAYDEDTDYSYASAEKVKNEYSETLAELKRITGIMKFSDVIRLHKFAGSLEVCKELHKLGVNALLTSDDSRKSYYLSEEEENVLRTIGSYYDADNGLFFYRSLTRLENCKDILNEINTAEAKWERIEIFTHEWQMDQDIVRKQMRLCCNY